MDLEQLRFLTSNAGERALAQAALLPPDRLTRLTRLRREVAPHLAAGIVELLELRTRARAKFAHADRMFFTPEGLEQSTGETIAAYRASRFPAEAGILDACCGIGGDALALSHYAPVLSVDRNPVAAACALANARVFSELQLQMEPGLGSIVESSRNGNRGVHALCADVTGLDLARLRDRGIGAAFFDPSRRVNTREGRKRARNSEDYLPPLSWLNTLAAHFPFVGAKVSPAIDDETLRQFTSDGATVEFIAEGGECKEAVLWRGSEAEAWRGPQSSAQGEPYCATIVTKGMTAATLYRETEGMASISPPRAWLFEPNPAVIRAHLTGEIAARLHAALLDPQIAYLTAADFTPMLFATAYRILDWMPFHVKNVQAWLRTNGRRVEVVKKRGVDLEPTEVRKKLSSPALADNPPAVLVLTRVKEQTIAILCDLPAA